VDFWLENLFESRQILTDQTPRSLPNERGVVLFADPQNRPILLLTAASIRRTVISKWAAPFTDETSRKTDLRNVASTVFYTLLPSEYHCGWLYNRLVHILFPHQTKELLSLPPAHCVRLNPQEPWAAFSISSHPLNDADSLYWGPFPTRREADFFARTWNDCFSLCRNRPLALGGNGRNCSYFQMNLCPAECTRENQDSIYRERLCQALQMLQSPVSALLTSLRNRMKTLASELEFEKAQRLKIQIESIEKLQTPPYRWTTDLNKLKILHIAEGPRVRLAKQAETIYQAFLITSRTAENLSFFSLNSLETLLKRIQSPPGRCILQPQNPSEHLSLLSLFLYKSRPSGLWLNLDQTMDPEALRNQMNKTFGTSSQENQ
jgi:excinuclease UvrABC nuclease subunit